METPRTGRGVDALEDVDQLRERVFAETLNKPFHGNNAVDIQRRWRLQGLRPRHGLCDRPAGSRNQSHRSLLPLMLHHANEARRYVDAIGGLHRRSHFGWSVDSRIQHFAQASHRPVEGVIDQSARNDTSTSRHAKNASRPLSPPQLK